MKFKTKPQVFNGEILKFAAIIEGVEYPAGSVLMTGESGQQFVCKQEDLSKFDEVKSRSRN